MTIESTTRTGFGNAVRASAVGLFAGMAVTVLSPQSVPYVAAGLVALAVAGAVADRVRPSEGATG